MFIKPGNSIDYHWLNNKTKKTRPPATALAAPTPYILCQSQIAAPAGAIPPAKWKNDAACISGGGIARSVVDSKPRLYADWNRLRSSVVRVLDVRLRNPTAFIGKCRTFNASVDRILSVCSRDNSWHVVGCFRFPIQIGPSGVIKVVSLAGGCRVGEGSVPPFLRTRRPKLMFLLRS